MDQQLSLNDKDKSTLNSTKRSSLQINGKFFLSFKLLVNWWFIDRRDSATSSSRTVSPIAFFHDGVTIKSNDLHDNFMGAERRAQAIATAPRRKRYDDDDKEEEDDDEQKKSRKIF